MIYYQVKLKAQICFFLDAWLKIDYKIASWTVHNQMMDLL